MYLFNHQVRKCTYFDDPRFFIGYPNDAKGIHENIDEEIPNKIGKQFLLLDHITADIFTYKRSTR